MQQAGSSSAGNTGADAECAVPATENTVQEQTAAGTGLGGTVRSRESETDGSGGGSAVCMSYVYRGLGEDGMRAVTHWQACSPITTMGVHVSTWCM